MKIVRFEVNNETGYGLLEGDTIQPIEGEPYRQLTPGEGTYPLEEARLLAPCTPSKIVALGMNYRPHAEEMDAPLPDAPLIFLKPSTSVIGPEDNILYPPSSQRVDYEGELAVVFKKAAWAVNQENALDYVLGYTCFNDITARDLQKRDQQWTRSKGFNTFAAVGPCIETELDPDDVVLRTYLNGILKQRAHTSELIFSVREVISFVSHIMTLLPGDIIATGTPSGIGPMEPGDAVEVTIDEIGSLKNYVRSG